MAGGNPFPVWPSDDDIPAVLVPQPRQSRRGTYGHAKQSGDGTYLAAGVPWPWIRAAAAAGKSAVLLGLTIWQARKYANGGAAKIRAKDRKRAGLDRYQARRGLQQLVDAGLVRIVAGGRGRCTTVEMILDVKDAPPTSPPPS